MNRRNWTKRRVSSINALAEIDAFLKSEDYHVRVAKSADERARTKRQYTYKKIFLSSPWIEVLRNEYEGDGLHKWNNARVAQVCRIFHCTLYEACALVGEFDHLKVRQHREENRWPMYLTLQWSKLVNFKLKLSNLPDAQDIAGVKLLGRAA